MNTLTPPFKKHNILRWVKYLSTPILLLAVQQASIVKTLAQESSDVTETTVDIVAESTIDTLKNQAQILFQDQTGKSYDLQTNLIETTQITPLTDPRGQILGCDGQLLDDYRGYSVGLYLPDPSDPTESELGGLLSLTRTEFPDIPDNNIPEGIEPNTTNRNPYFLSNQEEGRYSFLLDRSRGQLSIGSTYIVMVDPPENSPYFQRRVKLEILSITPLGDREQVRYRATALDGLPIGLQGQNAIEQSTVLVNDADRVGLELLAVQFTEALCDPDQISIQKSGDRASAAPGDTVIYRLLIKNESDGTFENIRVRDILPGGFRFLETSPIASYDGNEIPLTVTHNQRRINFSADVNLATDETLIIIYAAQLTPDALRGKGENLASVFANRVGNGLDVKDGPARHRVRLSSGIISNCSTLVGRVFVDHNFDGEQQTGEAGVPNAVVFMDDGNRITTDEDGLFSVKCVLPGSRTGTLDLTSIPDYTLAQNRVFIERNSPSRLIRLSPGGIGRMNFGVTPNTQREEKQ